NLQTTVKTAEQFGLDLVTFHAGFVPHDPKDPTLAKLLDRVGRVARLFAAAGVTLAFETGQESGPALKAFLEQLGEPSVAVNFDPANMILYRSGDPLEALRLVGPWVRGCHLKDAVAAKVYGTWGNEVPVGTGQVDWPDLFRTMLAIDFPGWFCFERESGDRRVEDIAAGRLFVERLLRA
ncbi:MAG: sugar phosphate isomerase/epimerase family protein, partial [Thermoguttaceae bacterium]